MLFPVDHILCDQQTEERFNVLPGLCYNYCTFCAGQPDVFVG